MFDTVRTVRAITHRRWFVALGRSTLLVVALGGTAFAHPLFGRPQQALAQEEDPARVLARDQFSEGVTLMSAENWAGALGKFKAAGRYKMSAQVAFNIAECERNLGQFVAALGNYRLAVSKADVAGAEDVRDLAPKRIEELTPKIPKLSVKRKEGSAEGKLFVDGLELPSSSEGAALQIDPGEHTVTAVRGDVTLVTEKVTLAPGETRELEILVPDSAVAIQGPAGSSGVSVPGAILVGVGAASVVVGAVSIGVRQVAIADLEEACGDDAACPPDAEAAYDRGRLATGLAGVFFPLGAVSIVVGSILLATHGPSEEEAEASSGPTLTGVGFLGPDGTAPGLVFTGAF